MNPRRSQFTVRNGMPQPDDGRPPAEQHYLKHPSDLHADQAVTHLINATGEADLIKRGQEIELAHVYATLSLRDAVLEWAATLREAREARRAA